MIDSGVGWLAAKVASASRRVLGNDDKVDWPAPPNPRHLIDRAAMVVARPGVHAVMNRAEIGRDGAFGSQRIDMEDAKGFRPFGHAFIGIEEQQQPAFARPEPAP